MEDYLVYYNNTINPLEELINSEQLIIQIHKHEKYSKHDICMDICTCPNLQTRFPIMKIYSYFDRYTFNKIEDHDYIFSEYIMNSNSSKVKVKTTSYLSLTEPRYITPVDINNRILQKNYKFNKEEMVNIIRALNMPSQYGNTYAELVHNINEFFLNDIQSFNKNAEMYANLYNLSASRLKKPIYKYHYYGSKIPNYGSLIKKGV